MADFASFCFVPFRLSRLGSEWRRNRELGKERREISYENKNKREDEDTDGDENYI